MLELASVAFPILLKSTFCIRGRCPRTCPTWVARRLRQRRGTAVDNQNAGLLEDGIVELLKLHPRREVGGTGLALVLAPGAVSAAPAFDCPSVARKAVSAPLPGQPGLHPGRRGSTALVALTTSFCSRPHLSSRRRPGRTEPISSWDRKALLARMSGRGDDEGRTDTVTLCLRSRSFAP